MEFVKELVTLIGHLAWPAAIVILILQFKGQLRDFAIAITERVRDERTELSVGKDGLTLKTEMKTVQSQIEALQNSRDVLTDLLIEQVSSEKYGAKSKVPSPEAPNARQADEVPAELVRAADDYLKIDISDWRERVRAKDAAAREMAELVIRSDASKKALANSSNEGLILALSSAITLVPQEGDTNLLLQVSEQVERLHVRYRIAGAFGRLAEADLIEDDQLDEVKRILKLYREGADKSLGRRLEMTEAMLIR